MTLQGPRRRRQSTRARHRGCDMHAPSGQARAWARRSTAGWVVLCHLRGRRNCQQLQLLLQESPLPVRLDRSLASAVESPSAHPPATASAKRQGQNNRDPWRGRMTASRSRMASTAGLMAKPLLKKQPRRIMRLCFSPPLPPRPAGSRTRSTRKENRDANERSLSLPRKHAKQVAPE